MTQSGGSLIRWLTGPGQLSVSKCPWPWHQGQARCWCCCCHCSRRGRPSTSSYGRSTRTFAPPVPRQPVFHSTNFRLDVRVHVSRTILPRVFISVNNRPTNCSPQNNIQCSSQSPISRVNSWFLGRCFSSTVFVFAEPSSRCDSLSYQPPPTMDPRYCPVRTKPPADSAPKNSKFISAIKSVASYVPWFICVVGFVQVRKLFLRSRQVF